MKREGVPPDQAIALSFRRRSEASKEESAWDLPSCYLVSLVVNGLR